ncbi:S-layer homology domain-containing protein, partial [Bacillus solitudinis]
GYDDGTFKPNNSVTRAQFAVFFARTLDSSFKPNSRSNPASKGETFVVETTDWLYGYQKYEIELVETITDGSLAWDMIKNANMFNDEASEGKKYVLAKFRVKALDLQVEPLQVRGVLIDAVSKTGTVYSEFSFVVVPEPVLSTDLYIDGEYEGWASFMVNENDEPLLVWERGSETELWFKMN